MSENVNNKGNNLFLCTTQYQLYNAICIANSFADSFNNQIVIIDTGNNISDKIDNESLGIFFNNVYNVNVVGNGNKYLYIIKNAFKKKPFGLEIDNICFDNVFLAGTEAYSKIIASRFISKNTNVFFLEDGIETYINTLDKDYKKKQDFVLSLIIHKNIFKIAKGAYVHYPDLITVNNTSKSIYQIQRISDNLLKHLPNIFKQAVKPFKSKYVFLNAYFEDKGMADLQRDYIKIFKESLIDDCCVKRHPRETDDLLIDIKEEDCGNFEIANMVYNMEDKVFVSIISTAAITPYFLFYRKPTVVFLYKEFMNHFEREDWIYVDTFLEKMTKKDDLKNKFFVVKTIQEYKDVLKELKGE